MNHVTIRSSVLVEGVARKAPVTVKIGDRRPSFTLGGNPTRESRDRIRAAMLASGFNWPGRNIEVSVDISRPSFDTFDCLDLPIALGVLMASGAIDVSSEVEFAAFGSLGLDGSLRSPRFEVSLAAALTTFDNLEVVVAPNARLHVIETVLDDRAAVLGVPSLLAAVSELEAR
jgi:magnesium chelatase family protein